MRLLRQRNETTAGLLRAFAEKYQAWQRENGNAHLSGIAFENVFDFIPSRRWPVHFGAYAEYERNMAEGPDHIELKLLMQHVQGPVDLRFNIVTERETGDHSDNRWEFGYASQASYRVSPTLRLGVEGFGDTGFDDQLGDIDDYAHYWGPFARLRLTSVRDQQLSLQLGYLAGSGHADANSQLRLQLEWSFNEDDGELEPIPFSLKRSRHERRSWRTLVG